MDIGSDSATQNYFSRTFRQVFGVSPHQYRRISRGQAVRAGKESPKL
ncbi:MAG: helix-turn-helix transcriptional regulator [Acutalibacteraceae bacterium]